MDDWRTDVCLMCYHSHANGSGCIKDYVPRGSSYCRSYRRAGSKPSLNKDLGGGLKVSLDPPRGGSGVSHNVHQDFY